MEETGLEGVESTSGTQSQPDASEAERGSKVTWMFFSPAL